MKVEGSSPWLLVWMRATDLRNRLTRTERSKLKIAVVTVFGAAFWIGLFAGFAEALAFIRKQDEQIAREVMEYLLAIFFFFLGTMLAFSNAIIAWTSLFRSAETSFLMAAPLREEHLYLYKFSESLWFSSWASLFLATPLMAAYGWTLGVGLGFYAGSALLIGLFIFIPAGIGNLAALLIARYVPAFRRPLLILTGGAILGCALFLIYQILSLRGYGVPLQDRWMRAVLKNLAFSQSHLCPSYWVAGGISSLAVASRPEAFGRGSDLLAILTMARNDFLLYALALLANALILGRGGFVLARRWFFESWCAAQASDRRRRFRENRLTQALWNGALGFVAPNLRLLMLKDLRSFVRDPVQWSQFVIFFGLLGVYFLNLRSFAYHLKFAEWKMLIALLNLCATSLTLSTFTTRFVFPQLSLEGRRFWLLGVSPTDRGGVLAAKFLFCFLGSLAVSEALIVTSSLMLRVAPSMMILHAAAVVGICFGLSGLSVGLGAVYPDFREDNPSKIVSGFGGTLNLILSLAFIATMIALTAFLSRRTLLGADAFVVWNRTLATSLAGVLGASLIWGGVPLAMGHRALRRLEL